MIWIILLTLLLPQLLLLYYFPRPHGMKESEEYDACIILGSPAKPDGSVSRMQKSRMNKAIQLYKQHRVSVLIISGGGVRNAFVEADVMADYAYKQGVPKLDVIKESAARNTYENLKNTKEVCERFNYHRVVVVTSRFHVRRAAFFVRKFFPTFAMCKTDDEEKVKHYLAEYVRMWNCLRIEWQLKSRKKHSR